MPQLPTTIASSVRSKVQRLAILDHGEGISSRQHVLVFLLYLIVYFIMRFTKILRYIKMSNNVEKENLKFDVSYIVDKPLADCFR